MRTILVNSGLMFLALVVALLASEGVLAVLGLPHVPLSLEAVYDERLLYRMPSTYPGIDEHGFRNSPGIDEVDVVAMGDSHTYGFNVSSDKSWPAQFGEIVGAKTYNLGIGGYGPLQYFHLTEFALSLKPKYMAVALYPSNDLHNICELYCKSRYWKENASKLQLELEYCGARQAGQNGSDQEQADDAAVGGVSLWRQYVKSLRSVTLAKNAIDSWSLRKTTENLPDKYISVKYGSYQTLLNQNKVNAHFRYTDLGDPINRRSLAVLVDLFRRMKEKAVQSGVQMFVVLVPSKESVLAEFVSEDTKDSIESYRALLYNENLINTKINDELTALGIPVVDASDDVRKALHGAGQQVYPKDWDGHPLEGGYKAYAQAVYEGFWRKQGPKIDGEDR